MAITTTSFVSDPRTGQMIPDSGAPLNVNGNDSSGGLHSVPVPAPAMTTGAGKGRVVIKKAR